MILVTGATGLSGSAVIREFVRQKVPVRALIRDPAKARMFDGMPTVDLVEGNMLRPKTLGAAFQDVNRILMISSPRERMVDTQCTFIDGAKAAGIRHIVKFSGKESGVGFDPNSFRGTRWHEEIERYLESSGLAWTHLRPSQFMQFYLPQTLTGVDPAERALVMPIGDSQLSPVDIEDIAKVAVALLRTEGHEGRSYDMTGPEALTTTEVVEQISGATGQTFRYVKVSLEEKRHGLAAAGIPPEVVDLLDELFTERRRCTRSGVDLSAHETFDVEPTTFAQFARRNASAFLAKPARPSPVNASHS
ncbi:MAG: hypothetical protein QOE61_4771 [Micromonosporaceae bacterium]|jgi:uncharacterized protein YbjT (DUF2867 family)|nr:hypothetical protein [Micromonosporaceae bacterium]